MTKASHCEPSPCLNSGICIDDEKKIDGYVCKCSSDFTGKRCQVSRPAAENPVMKRTEVPRSNENKEGFDFVNLKKDSSVKEDEVDDQSLLYEKVGCYRDDTVSPDLKTKTDLTNLTQETCVKACYTENDKFSYFGLQNGTSCFCGDKFGRYGKLDSSECNSKCVGDRKENCGGINANNIYFYGKGTNYTMKTFTGQKLGAGTDAKIYVEFIGERGNSDFRKLDDHLDKYEPGSIDKQTFMLPNLGNLKRMKILHDNSGTAPSWYLDKIEMTDGKGKKFFFDCNDWLSDTQSGGKLERELIARTSAKDNT